MIKLIFLDPPPPLLTPPQKSSWKWWFYLINHGKNVDKSRQKWWFYLIILLFFYSLKVYVYVYEVVISVVSTPPFFRKVLGNTWLVTGPTLCVVQNSLFHLFNKFNFNRTSTGERIWILENAMRIWWRWGISRRQIASSEGQTRYWWTICLDRTLRDGTILKRREH